MFFPNITNVNEFENVTCLSRKDMFKRNGVSGVKNQYFSQSNLEYAADAVNESVGMRKLDSLEASQRLSDESK